MKRQCSELETVFYGEGKKVPFRGRCLWTLSDAEMEKEREENVRVSRGEKSVGFQE